MYFNWFDYILLGIIIISFIYGFIKGLIRQIVGLSALVIGVILAIYFYKNIAELVFSFIQNKMVSYLLGFLLIFISVIIFGMIISFILSKLIRGPLKTMNHILGGIFGILRGALICIIIVFLLMAFPLGNLNEKILSNSKITPYCVTSIKIIINLIPKEIKDEFNKNYQKIIKKIRKDGKRV